MNIKYGYVDLTAKPRNASGLRAKSMSSVQISEAQALSKAWSVGKPFPITSETGQIEAPNQTSSEKDEK